MSIENDWISVDSRPLITKGAHGNWTCTKDGEREFIAAVPYSDENRPNEINLWWIRHCVIEDKIGLLPPPPSKNTPPINKAFNQNK